MYNNILWICGIAWMRDDNTYFPEATYPGIVSGSAFQQAIIEGLEAQNSNVRILSDCDMSSGKRLEWSHNGKSHDIRVAGSGNRFLRIPTKIIELFKEIGVDNVVSGGQTMNPSTADLLKAVNSTAAEHVFILPNNKNIIMAAEQVAPLTSKKVHVLPTKTIPQGITAMLNFDESLRSKENMDNMMVAANRVQTGQVTFAARDSVVEGKSVKQGEILGLENGKITEIEHSPVKAGYKITKSLIKKIDASMVTIIYGEDSSEEEANELEAMISAKFAGKVDVSVLCGGQPVYSFVISVE